MNVFFIKSIGRFLWKLSLCAGLFLFPLMVMGQIMTTYISPATVSGTPPQVNATNFYNAGTWNIGTVSPYETAYTLNYTNKGSMTGTVGWEFDWGAAVLGPRKWSANFFNKSGASVTALDYGLPNPISAPNVTPMSFLLVSATNIVNQGTLVAGNSGEVILTGSGVNLTGSQVGINPLIVPSEGGVNGSNGAAVYTPDLAIYDEYWGTSNNMIINGSVWSGSQITGATFNNDIGTTCVAAPISFGINGFMPTYLDWISNNTGPFPLVVTNSTGSNYIVNLYTNQFREAVFVHTGDSAITGQIHFQPLSTFQEIISGNLFQTVAVQLAVTIPSATGGAALTGYLYLEDTLGSNPQLGLLANASINPYANCSGTTYRPTNYFVARSDTQGYFITGNPGLYAFYGPPPANFFYDPLTFTNAIITNAYWSLYSDFVDEHATEVQSGVSVSNLTGRVRIYADNLNLYSAGVSAVGQIRVKATNLISSANAVMDCENLSYDLGANSGLLNFTNLAPVRVRRFHGQDTMWSALWTNYEEIVTINYMPTNVTLPSGATTTNWSATI